MHYVEARYISASVIHPHNLDLAGALSWPGYAPYPWIAYPRTAAGWCTSSNITVSDMEKTHDERELSFIFSTQKTPLSGMMF